MVLRLGRGIGGGGIMPYSPFGSAAARAAAGAPPQMPLLEYRDNALSARPGLPVPSGEVASTVEKAVAAAERIGYPCAIKAQVLIGGRGKAGGIKIAQDADEAERYANDIIGMDIT